MLENIDGVVEKKVKQLSDVLVGRRTAFFNYATISTQSIAISTQTTAFKILDGMENISTQLQDLSRKVLDAGRWSLVASGLPI